jgi:hypothetical protein
MVKGLALFAEHFRDHRDRYVLIGGAACDLALEAAGVGFRATKDLDIVLCVEASDTAFAAAFWAFVDLGGYEVQEGSTGDRRLYRFRRPTDAAYPVMLELFSARPEALEPRDGAILTPIPFDGEVASLSAILLDESYAAWIRAGRTEVEGVSILTATHLIPLKARAWIDLTARVLAGQRVDSADIRKHRNDVFRLVAVIEPGVQLDAPKTIRDDMDTFLKEVSDEAVDLKAMGLGTMLMGEAVEMLRGVYRTA